MSAARSERRVYPRLKTGADQATRLVHLATPHGDLDLLSKKLAGIPSSQLRERADVTDVDGVPAPICSLVDLVAMKRAVGRDRAIADLSDLETAHGELPTPSS